MKSQSAFASWTPFAAASNSMTSRWQMCNDIAAVLESSNGVQLIENFQRSLDDVFAITNGWSGQPFPAPVSLLLVTSMSEDYYAYYDLLKISGPVFRAIDRLISTEPSLRFTVDTSTGIKSLDSSQLSTEPAQIGGLKQMNPLEYYFLRFAQYLLNASCTYPHVDSDQLDCIYVALLKDYLISFLPSDGIFPTCVMSKAASSVSADHRGNRYFTSEEKLRSNQIRGTPLGLLRRELFTHSEVASDFSPSRAQATKYSEVLWKSTALLSTLLDCWFSIPGNHQLYSTSLSSFAKSTFAAGTSTRMTAASSFSMVTISSAVAMVNRAVIEHLHNFVYCPSSVIIDSQFRDFKENRVPRLVASRMWTYLQYAFGKWPLDSSFRLLLELWFAYIQPWHFAVDQNRTDEPNYSSHWEIFVKEHIAFYEKFFHSALQRLLRMDLSAHKNAFMLYRVACVFSSPGLMAVLGWTNANLPLQLNEIAPDARTLVVTVTSRAREAFKFCSKTLAEEKAALDQQSWMTWFLSMVMAENDETAHLMELDRARQCLDIAVQYFQASFGFQLPDTDINGRAYEEQTTALARSFNSTEKEPECEHDDDGRLRLTPRGRRQLLNATRRFDFRRINWPSDLKPVDSSCEIAFLAEILNTTSSKINAKYGRKFEVLYRQPRGIVAWMCRKCLAPPTRLVRRNSPVVERRPNELKARVNLRSLASYRFLCWFCFVWLLISVFFGFRCVFLIFFIGSIMCLLCVYLVLEYHPAVRNF